MAASNPSHDPHHATYLRDSLVRRLVNALHALLEPGGVLLTSNLHSLNPHRTLMEYVADWQTIHRSPAELEGLMLDSSRFDRLELTVDPSLANLLFAGRAR